MSSAALNGTLAFPKNIQFVSDNRPPALGALTMINLTFAITPIHENVAILPGVRPHASIFARKTGEWIARRTQCAKPVARRPWPVGP
jgi:hypothetical protein